MGRSVSPCPHGTEVYALLSGMGKLAGKQGLKLVHVSAQLEQLQDTLMV